MMPNIDGILERIGLRTRVAGLAMSGGGARGFCHVGVIEGLESFGIRPGVISGVSAGSIAAALYGAGLSPRDMLDCFAGAPKFNDFTEWTIPKEGLFKMTKFARLLESWLPVRNLEDMKIPTVICAADFDHGKSVGWAKGEIVPRVIASCSIPVIFPPVRINGVDYVDGGVLRNLPAWAIREYCTDLYGSNCSPLNRRGEHKASIVNIALRSFQLMQKANVPQDLKLCDYVISPRALSQYSTFDLSEIRRIVRLGYDTTCRVLENAGKTSRRDPGDYPRWI
ncbi:MAG: patatin-like phospholipase family protein [Muribaculaceae bacterium]|nr:patatin-like phospholipase family protein [Muribaculaceae bacterium]